MQYSRKCGSTVPTKWTDEEIDMAMEGQCMRGRGGIGCVGGWVGEDDKRD